MIFDDVMQDELDKLSSLDSLRTIVAKKQYATTIEDHNHVYCDLSSNDYLGLGQDEILRDEFISLLKKNPQSFSSSGSPLLTGAHESYAQAQDTVETLFPNKKCLFFNSGFAANSGVTAALGQIKGTLILADKLSHASIIDGITSNHSIKALRYAHNDMQALERLVGKYESAYERILVITEAVFSMDGDKAPLKELVKLKKLHPKIALYIDEAHSFGVFGEKGLGLCAQEKVLDDIDFILCTCGKALGSQGAFLLCSAIARSYLINKVRPLIFSTAIAPVAFAHISFMLQNIIKCDERREHLAKISAQVRDAVVQSGSQCASSTQIVPFITYTNEQTMHACKYFREQGFYVMPIRHPTVPKNTARLRISLNAAISDAEIAKLCTLIREYAHTYLKEFGPCN